MSENSAEIHLVVAATENDVIGKDNTVPWHYEEDVRHYKSTVAGHPVVVGRRTFERMDPLPESLNIILTSDESRTAERTDVVYAHSLADAVTIGEETGSNVVYVIGGQGVYEAFLPYTNRVILSRIHDTVDGDRFFPVLGEEWREVSRDEREGFTIFEYVQEHPKRLER